MDDTPYTFGGDAEITAWDGGGGMLVPADVTAAIAAGLAEEAAEPARPPWLAIDPDAAALGRGVGMP